MNIGTADSYGAEFSAAYQVRPDWRLSGSYTFIDLDVQGDPSETIEGSSPRHRFYLQSSWDLCNDWEFDLTARYVDNLPDFDIPSYMTMDVRLAWSPCEHREWALVGATCSIPAIRSLWIEPASLRPPESSRKS